MTDIIEYGFSGRFQALAAEFPQWQPARALSQEKGLYRVVCSSGEVLAEVSGKFRYQAQSPSDFPAVGDFVMIETSGGSGVIHHVLDRKSAFIRKSAGTAHTEQVVAANVDTVFICMSLNNDFNLRRLERYVSVAWDSGATPVAVLTKADLCDCSEDKKSEVISIAPGVAVIVTSSAQNGDFSQVMTYIKPGQTVAFLGSSGVGKSTLINRLIGEDKLCTNGLRDDDKGRHTTTRRELILLPSGGIVMDTPGMRELGMWDVGTGIDRTFDDIANLAESCRFSDCTHHNEPGCAVRAAISSGELTEERWSSYQKLKTEAAYAEDAEGYLAAKEKKFKNIAKMNKSNKKW